MPASAYPNDWQALREAVHLRDRGRCQNCHREEDDIRRLDVHHVVSLSHGGSNRMSNLILLCRRCHDAAHEKRMAPRVKFYSKGQMSGDEFREYQRLWKTLDVARFDGDEKCWYIPRADVELVRESFAS